MLIWGFFSLIFSFSPFDTLRELLRIFDTIFLALLGFIAVDTKERFSFLLKSILVSSIIPCIVGIYQYVNGIGFSDDAVSIPRIYGTFSHPNIFSLYLFILIVVILLLFVLKKKHSPFSTFLLFCIGGFFLAMLLLTYTRVAWVILFAFFFLLALARFRALLIPLIILPTLMYVFILPIRERVDSVFHNDPGSSVVWRQAMWKFTIQKTLSEGKEIAGYGLNTFPLISGQIPDPTIGSNEAHNDFVKFFVEGGLVGLAVYLLSLFTLSFAIFRRLWQTRAQSKELPHLVFLILGALWIALVFASLSDNIFKNTPVQWIFWVLLGASFRVFGASPVARQRT
jgi:O-antigen ligase